MKRASIFLIASFLCISLHVSRTWADSELWQDQAQREVGAVVQEMFNALKTRNVTQYNKLVTQDFYLYDAGERLSREAFAEIVQESIAKGTKYDWKITKPEAHISSDLAWITYTNIGLIESAKGKQEKNWLESAVLERHDKTWRIRFLHSTLVPKKLPTTKP